MKTTQEEAKFAPIRITVESKEEFGDLYESLLLSQDASEQQDAPELKFIQKLINLLDEYR